MANESTETGIMQKGEYKHPDFPNRLIGQLRADADKFNIDDHLVAFLFSEPFYADIIRSLHKVRTESIPTAGVLHKDDIMKMWWNPLFLAAYNAKQVGGILKHESLHLALEHTTTRRYKPHLAWNWATDLAINSTLSDDEMPPCGLKPGKKFNVPHDFDSWSDDRKKTFEKVAALVESFPLHLAGEEYFARLLDSKDFQNMMKGNEKSGSGGEGEEGYGSMDSHDGWDELSDDEREYVSSKIRNAVKEAQQNADSKNRWGSCPVEMRAEIRRRVQGEIDWKAVLRRFVGHSSRSERISSVFRANKKYPGIHPGASREYRPRIGVYVDQSGSVSDNELELIFNELGCLANRVDFYVYHFDCTVDEESKTLWKKGGTRKAYRTRSGGTCFDAPTIHANKLKYEGMIICTDGGAEKPQHSKIRRCFVVTPGHSLAFADIDSRDVVVKMKFPTKGATND